MTPNKEDENDTQEGRGEGERFTNRPALVPLKTLKKPTSKRKARSTGFCVQNTVDFYEPSLAANPADLTVELQMNWLFAIVRVAGASFPGAASLVQLQSELSANALAERISKLEDPISFLHEDVPELSKHLYAELKSRNRIKMKFDDEFYRRFSRAFAALDARGLINCQHALGRDLPVGISVSDPSYVIYLCALYECNEKMEALVKRVDECKVGQWINGKKIAEEIDLPLPVVAACFQIYESKGYGMCSAEIGAVNYCGNA